MGSSPGQDANANLVDRVARAIGAAHEELWPIRKSSQPRLPAEVMNARAAASALAIAREAVERIELPDGADDAQVQAYRMTVLKALEGVG